MKNISLKKVTAHDLDFLFKIYADTRAEEVAQTGWPVKQQLEFLAKQFQAQHQHYQQYYSEASFDLIMLDGQAVGRLYVSHWPTQIRIVDIALLREFRSQKIGGILLSRLFSEAKEKQLEISIHVEKNNPAMKWYLALGFKEIEDKGVYSLMITHFLRQKKLENAH